LVATAAFIVLMALLSIRHNPAVTGYYYGASFCLFFALITGLALAVLGRMGSAWSMVAAAGAWLI